MGHGCILNFYTFFFNFEIKVKKMNKYFHWNSNSLWNTALTISLIFSVFIVPLFPEDLQRFLFRLSYTFIYISALFSLERKSKKLLILFFTTFFVEWISAIFDLDLLNHFSKGLNILFFIVIIIFLIRQIALSKEVTPGVILGSFTGYLLLGLMYSIFVSIILVVDPGSFSNIGFVDLKHTGTSTPIYYSFVTIASLGYGDICPLKPYTRSLATLIVISGQFYMAIIVALLVGKFSSANSSK